MSKKITREMVVGEIQRRTREYFDANEISEIEPQAIAIANKILGKFSSEKAMAELMDVLTGLHVSAAVTGNDYPYEIPFGVAFVPTGNASQHSYPLGKVSLTLNCNWSNALKPDGSIGNAMGIKKDQVRPATSREIEEISPAIITEVMKKTFMVVAPPL